MNYLILVATTCSFNLSDLPSPAAIVDSIMQNSLGIYQKQIKRTSIFLAEYTKMSRKDRDQLIVSWVRDSKDARKKARGLLSNSASLSRDYLITSDLERLDLTKLDILRMADHKQPIFHTRFWLDCVYQTGSKNEKSFVVPERIRILPSMFSSFSGRIKEPAMPSFDPFYDEESAMVEDWVNSKLKDNL
jgi:transcription antitermination factor NusG